MLFLKIYVILLVLIVIFTYPIMRVGSECSRREEQEEFKNTYNKNEEIHIKEVE